MQLPATSLSPNQEGRHAVTKWNGKVHPQDGQINPNPRSGPKTRVWKALIYANVVPLYEMSFDMLALDFLNRNKSPSL